MTELIVRELRLRAYDGLVRALPPRGGAMADGVTDVDGSAPEEPGAERLAVRYSRRRVRPGELEL